jgi:hypothetical protein
VVDHDYVETMLLQAMFYLAEGKMDGNLFSQFCAKLFLKLQGRGRMNHRIVEPQ